MTLLQLAEVRPALAQVLAPAADGDPPIQADLVDALDPPVILLEWSDPWLTPRTIGGDWWDAHIQVLCVVHRMDPAGSYAMVEQMVGHVRSRLQADDRSWPVESSISPRTILYQGLNYLFCRLTLRVPVTIETEEP